MIILVIQLVNNELILKAVDYNLKFEYLFLNQINDKFKKHKNTSEVLEKEERKYFLWQKLLKMKEEL